MKSMKLAIGLVVGLSGGFLAAELIAGRPGFKLALAGGGAATGAMLVMAPLHQTRKELRETIEKTRAERKELKKSISDLRLQIEALTRQKTGFLADIKGLTDQAEKLTYSLDSARAETMSAHVEGRKLKECLTESQKDLAEAEDELDTWEAKFDEALASKVQEGVEKVQEQLIEEYGIRFQNALPKALQTRITKIKANLEAEYGSQIEELEKNLEELEKALKTKESQLEAMLLEFGGIQDDEFAESLENRKAELYDAAAQRIAELEDVVRRKDLKLEELERPRRFPRTPPFEIPNTIIHVAEVNRITLDGVWRKESTDGTTQTFFFQWRAVEGSPIDIVNSLDRLLDKFKENLLGIKNISRFDFDPQYSLIKVTVTLREKLITKDVIDNMWLRSSQFKKVASLQENVFRVSGSKRGGKSPFVRNLLGCKLLQGEAMHIRRFDPSAGSGKDYWRIAPEWTEYEQAEALAEEMVRQVKERKAAIKAGHQFKARMYFVIDEIDNIIANTAEIEVDDGRKKPVNKQFMDAIMTVAKEADHAHLGLIISGQSPNTKSLKADEKAAFNSFVQIHIDENVSDYLTNTNNTSNNTKLRDTYNDISSFCNRENDNEDDLTKHYRFALWVHKSRREFIELPLVDSYGFDKADPTQPYEFERFNTDDYPVSIRTLDHVLRMGTQGHGGVHAAPHIAPENGQNPYESRGGAWDNNTGTNEGQIGAEGTWSAPRGGSGDAGNNCRRKDSAIGASLKNTPLPQEKCPICGSAQVRRRGKGTGSHTGEIKYTCQNPKHPKGQNKTFYVK